MDIESLTQRIEALQKMIEQGAGEINKVIGRVEEARMWLQHLTEKESGGKAIEEQNTEGAQA